MLNFTAQMNALWNLPQKPYLQTAWEATLLNCARKGSLENTAELLQGG